MNTHVERAVHYALAQVGKKYRLYGATRNGSQDCSGLVMNAWHDGGVELPHNSSEQFHATERVLHHKGKDIKPLRAGDIAFYYKAGKGVYGHCAILVRHDVHGWWIVNATNEARGIELIRRDAYAPAVAYGRPRYPGWDKP